MKTRYQVEEQQEESLDINVSPLIDIVFMLLIFFIVTAVFSQEPSVEINRPSSVTAQVNSEEAILIALSEAGTLYYKNELISQDDLRRIISNNAKSPVIIRADAQTRTQQLISVIDIAQIAGAKNVSVSSEIEQ